MTISATTLQNTFIILTSLFLIGGAGSLFFRKNDSLANIWSNFFAVLASLTGIFLASIVFIYNQSTVFSFGSLASPIFSISFHIDKLSAFFIFTISLISLFCSIYAVGYAKHFYGKYNIGSLGFFYHAFILGMLLVVTSSNALFFLVAWELMSIASYFLVVYDRKDENNVKAGFLYLIMTHVGTACILLAFLLAYKFTNSFDFGAIASASALIPLWAKNTIFILSVVGFGTKSGIIPFHIWLPDAHPAAPSHVSALMSGVMIKTGIYMMIRIFLVMLWPVPTWWGLTLLVLGAISSLLGVLYALTEHDIKRLLAYHSIENIGIILLGLGSALTFLSLEMPSLALLGFIGALFHILNHATFKSLLFLGAGSVVNQTHTRNMEEYGGLIKYMPQTALFFLVGSMSISALPPFNGFFSEWLTFQTLFQGIASLDFYAKWIFVGAAAVLAFTGGLALACFVKVFSATFLARPRSSEVAHAKEAPFSMRFGMGALAVLSLLLGIYSGHISAVLGYVGRDVSIFHDVPALFLSSEAGRLVVGNFSSVSAPVLFALLLVVLVVTWGVVRFFVYKKQEIHTGITWDCGTDLTPRMEITATGFSRSIISIFKSVLKPSMQHAVEYHDAVSRYLPKTRTVTLGVSDMYRLYLYEPINGFVVRLSRYVKRLQNGIINAYMLYMFVVLLVVLFLAVR